MCEKWRSGNTRGRTRSHEKTLQKATRLRKAQVETIFRLIHPLSSGRSVQSTLSAKSLLPSCSTKNTSVTHSRHGIVKACSTLYKAHPKAGLKRLSSCEFQHPTMASWLSFSNHNPCAESRYYSHWPRGESTCLFIGQFDVIATVGLRFS